MTHQIDSDIHPRKSRSRAAFVLDLVEGQSVLIESDNDAMAVNELLRRHGVPHCRQKEYSESGNFIGTRIFIRK